MFAGVDFARATEPSNFVGRAPEQVDRFIADVVDPIRTRHAAALRDEPVLEV
jgi:adenylosuccinate lyase